jgi:hypothetical protein
MRRQFTIIAFALLFVGGVALSADEAILIDFSLLKADVIANPANQGKMTQNKQTMMDFSGIAGASYTDDQKKQMRVSLAVPNWDVELASSSKTLLNQSLSMTAETTVAATGTGNNQFAGKTVFGVRIHFPTEPFNSWARVNPPFEIPAFEPKATVDDTGTITPVASAQGTDPVNARLTRFEGTYDPNTKITTALGIVKNVGTLKSVAVTVKGLNFPHGLYIALKDANGNDKTIFMGYLNFDGWKELRWDNPQYVNDVRNRELQIYPLYPSSVPFVKFDGFVITRDASTIGGDFVAYFKDVKILYDKAVLDPIRDIDDESVWGIIAQREAERKLLESRNFGNQQVERYLERQRQELKTNFTPNAAPATK